MNKTALKAPRTTAFMVQPEELTLVTEETHPLFDPRVHLKPDETLIRNIMVYGVLEPVLVRKNGDDIEVLAGRQRVKAAIEANRRLEAEGKVPLRVPCMVKRGQDADLFGVIVSENEQRLEDTPLARADKAQRLIDMGKTEAEAAIAFGVSIRTIKNWLALQDLCAPVRKAVERGQISATAAAELAGLARNEQRDRLEELKASGQAVTVERARKAASTGDTTAKPRMRTRKDINARLKDSEDTEEFQAALRWVLNEAPPAPEEQDCPLFE